jgi:hypothetical protein
MGNEHSLTRFRNGKNGQKYNLNIIKFVEALLRHKLDTAKVVGMGFQE